MVAEYSIYMMFNYKITELKY